MMAQTRRSMGLLWIPALLLLLAMPARAQSGQPSPAQGEPPLETPKAEPGAEPESGAAAGAEAGAATAPGSEGVVEEPGLPPAVAVTPETPGTLSLTSRAAGVEVALDGQWRGVTPLTLRGLPPGSYTLSARAGAETWEGKVTLEPGRDLRVELPLPSAGPERPGFFEAVRWPTWTVAALGLACLAAGTGLAVDMQGHQSAFNDTVPLTQADIRAMEDHRDMGQQEALAANVLLGVGGAALAGAAVMAAMDYLRGD